MKKWKKICYGCLPFFTAFILIYILTFFFLIGSGVVWGIFHYEQIRADSNVVSGLFLNEAWLKEIQILGNCFIYLVFCCVFGIWYKRGFLPKGGMRPQHRKEFSFPLIGGAMVLGISIQCFCSNVLNLILPLFPKIQSNYLELLEDMGTGQGIFPLLYMGILAPIVEELIFRGLILGYEKRELPFWCANFIQALFFGVYHQNVVQFVYAFSIGLLLGYLCERLQSLKMVMLIHGIINISGNLFAFLKLDILWEEKTDMFLGIGISMIAAIASCLFLLRKKQ
ncbi:MAG: CPBP family intramembrane metalloprotease [Lachnospiraceae bacterium]|nr:CPBP family intramembrane metalloprotease [Lachnospiraceae bacterium]